MFTQIRHITTGLSGSSLRRRPGGALRWGMVRHWTGLCLCLLFAACTDNGPTLPPPPDSEVRLTLRIDAGASQRSASLPDPGEDHGEYHAPWTTLGVYLAYANGDVLSYSLSREQFEAGAEGHGGFRHVAFDAYAGRLTVYAVAFGEGQTFTALKHIDELRNLTTQSLEEVPETGRRAYLQSLFSGKSAPVEVTAEGFVHIDVTLHRLAAKIDVQYDVQDAFELNGYTRAALSAVTHRAPAAAAFFPEESKLTFPLSYEQRADGAVSERNGRVSFYSLPGARNELEFAVDYRYEGESTERLDGEVPYRAQFAEALQPATWHYVLFTIRGSKTAASDNITLSN